MQEIRTRSLRKLQAHPIVKWAGGKGQLLAELVPKLPAHFGNYIEPFFGGGALFFATLPPRAVIADSNPELINVYRMVAEDVEAVIKELGKFSPDEESFYRARRMESHTLSPAAAAARTIYLNKTCFNGLYRVNRQGHFNVPFGRYKNPKICDPGNLRIASDLLSGATIVCADYKKVLSTYATEGDFVFLDPPYLPTSQYSDFKRYTKEQFYEEDHRELAAEIFRLHELGCFVILTNSNHPLVHELYSHFNIEIIRSRRNINNQANGRTGEDAIVTIPPRRKLTLSVAPEALPKQVEQYPTTRFMGSKEKLLSQIWDVSRHFQFETVLDLFSGSGVVGYLYKTHDKAVIANDYMAMSATYTKALIENNSVRLTPTDVDRLFQPDKSADPFVTKTFSNLYFSRAECKLIDLVRANISTIRNPNKRALAMASLIRACIKKRPRGIFTYVGDRYDDGRQDLRLSLEEQIRRATDVFNDAVFDNGRKNFAKRGDAMLLKCRADLVYIDPPYYSPLSDNEYVRRYHFVEGLACDWQGVEMQWHTKTKKFKSYPTPFSSRIGAAEAFDALFRKFRESILIVSYSSNSLPTKDEMLSLLAKHKRRVDAIEIQYRYSFGTQGHKVGDNNNDVKEYLFVGY